MDTYKYKSMYTRDILKIISDAYTRLYLCLYSGIVALIRVFMLFIQRYTYNYMNFYNYTSFK